MDGRRNMKISVIMPVCLAPYQSVPETSDQFIITSASEPEMKFIRAVKSFINQTFKDAELIIISDGDRRAEEIYIPYWSHLPNIRFKYIEKQILYSGIVRQTGIKMAKGEIICYLDHDDMFGKDHLQIINDNFDTRKYDWVYYDDYIINGTEISLRDVQKEICKIGTSSIAHRRNVKLVWGNNYGHDWHMIEKYLIPLPRHVKIPIPQYYVCHNSNINQ
jgi:glycosyltransferase involved in cell wall biosynthesis